VVSTIQKIEEIPGSTDTIGKVENKLEHWIETSCYREQLLDFSHGAGQELHQTSTLF